MSQSGGPSAEEIAVVTAAYLALQSPGVVVDEVVDATPPWRFAGRWFGAGRRFPS